MTGDGAAAPGIDLVGRDRSGGDGLTCRSSHGLARDYRVRLAYFVPHDRQLTARYQEKIRMAAGLVADLYRLDLQAKGYRTEGLKFEAGEIKLVRGTHAAAAYNDAPGYEANQQRRRLQPEIRAQVGDARRGVIVVFAETYDGGPAAHLCLQMGGAWENPGLVVTKTDGGFRTPDNPTHAFLKLRRKLGVGVTFHGLRHSHATILLSQGVQPKVLSERLGHSSIAITQDLYAHVRPHMQDGAAQELDAAFAAALARRKKPDLRVA